MSGIRWDARQAFPVTGHSASRFHCGLDLLRIKAARKRAMPAQPRLAGDLRPASAGPAGHADGLKSFEDLGAPPRTPPLLGDPPSQRIAGWSESALCALLRADLLHVVPACSGRYGIANADCGQNEADGEANACPALGGHPGSRNERGRHQSGHGQREGEGEPYSITENPYRPSQIFGDLLAGHRM